MSIKKTTQLGLKPNTATNWLKKSLLFHFAVAAGHKCFRCGGDLDLDSFSIDHKVDWLDSDDPKGLFFSIENIAFSHLSCNKRAPRVATPIGQRSRSAHVRAYMARYYQERIKGKVTATDEFKRRRREYMREYTRKKNQQVSPVVAHPGKEHRAFNPTVAGAQSAGGTNHGE